jgi:hypothetical protein
MIIHFGTKPKKGGSPPSLNIISMVIMNIIGLIVASVLENLEEMVFFLINKDIKLTEMRI